MDVLQRHLPRVADALRSALEYLSAVATRVFGEPPPPTASPETDSNTSPPSGEVDYDRAEEALWTVGLPDETNDHQEEDSFSCIQVSTDALDLSAPRSRVTLRRVSSAKRQSSAGSQTRSITKASLEESHTDLLPEVQSSTEPPHGSISDICLEEALQRVPIHLQSSEGPQHSGTDETSLEDSHAGVSTQSRSWAELHYDSTGEASLEESIWRQLACGQSSAEPEAGDIGDTCPVQSDVGLPNQRQRSAEPQPGDIDETCLEESHEDLSSQSQRVSDRQLGDIDEICVTESRAVLSNKRQKSTEPQPGDIDETCLKWSHEDLSTQSERFLALQPGDIEVSCIPESRVGLSMQSPRLSELQSGNIDDTCLAELNEDLSFQGQSSAGSLPGDVKNAALEKESSHVDPAGVSLSTFYYSITEPTAEWCPQTQEDDIDEEEVDDEVLNLTGDLLQEMKEYLQAPLMGGCEKDETSSTGHEVERQEEEENDQPQDMVNVERSGERELTFEEEESSAPEGHLPFPEAPLEEDQSLLPVACPPPVKRDMISPTEAVRPPQEEKGQISLSIQDRKNDGEQEVRLEQDMESPPYELEEKYQNEKSDEQENNNHLSPLLEPIDYPFRNREETHLTAQGDDPMQDQYKIEGASSTACQKHSENVEETQAGEAQPHAEKEEDVTQKPTSTHISVLPIILGPEEQWEPAQPLHDRHSFKRKSIRQKQGKMEGSVESSHSQGRELESPPDELKDNYHTNIVDGQEKVQLIPLLKPMGYPLRNREQIQLTAQGDEPMEDQYEIEGASSTTCPKHSENVEEALTGEAHLHVEKEEDVTRKPTSSQISVLPIILGPEEQWEPAQPLHDRHSFKRKSIRQKQGKKGEPAESSHAQGRESPVGEAVSVTLDKVEENEDETDAMFRMGEVQTLDVSAQKDRVHLRRKVSVRRRQGPSSRPQSIREAPTEPLEPADLSQPIGEAPIEQVDHAASMWPVRETGRESQSHVGSGEDLHPQPPTVQHKPRLLPGMVPMMMPGMMPGMVRPPRPQPAPPAVEDSAIKDSTTKKAEEIQPKKKLPGHAGFGFAHPQMMQELQFRLRKPKPQ